MVIITIVNDESLEPMSLQVSVLYRKYMLFVPFPGCDVRLARDGTLYLFGGDHITDHFLDIKELQVHASKTRRLHDCLT
jgi:hypothetical protein